MSLLERLKSLLGLASPGEPVQEEPVAVTVEHEAGTAGSTDMSSDQQATDEQAVTTADTAEASAGAVTPDESEDAAEPTEETEPTDESESTTESVATEAPESPDEPETPEEPEAADEVDSEPAAEAEPVTEISGIGPAYSERLANADITTVPELAEAEASALAEDTDISETRLSGWIEAARDRIESR